MLDVIYQWPILSALQSVDRMNCGENVTLLLTTKPILPRRNELMMNRPHNLSSDKF